MRLLGHGLVAAVAVIGVMWVGGAKGEDKAPATQEAGPLKAVMIANTDAYTLDSAQAGKEFREKVEKDVKDGKKVPAAPKVDLTLRVTNTTDKEITIAVGGDESRVNFKLEGPGALTVPNMVAMTMEFRQGMPVKLGPGKSYDLAIKSLAGGPRGISEMSYWTEVGEYTVAATFTTTIGEKQVSVTSEGAKVKVTTK